MPMRTLHCHCHARGSPRRSRAGLGAALDSLPGAGPCSQVWFRRAFTVARPPLSARVTIASAGRYELFVNGYNVTTDVLAPSAGPPGDTIRVMTYEVGRFLRPDTNVVAVWYSPLAPHPQAALTEPLRARPRRRRHSLACRRDVALPPCRGRDRPALPGRDGAAVAILPAVGRDR